MKEKELQGTLDEKLLQTEVIKQQSWGKIVTYLKRQFDSWTTAQLAAIPSNKASGMPS